ncbi:SWIM zinc finger domain-containing protein [Patescibacteria group bacterium]|nr:SWIM zinc finger domain-containing protein [Patescibacteria group bacterium]MBU2220156.1 SWIM zinc finger domain-containing protein [Patescibacteria group bacterium]MBU2265116.1 SWIM zinc finger domain-containing protein [Patescibacteria group bacterium]
MLPTYNFDKIKFATDRPTLEKAIGLYENGKVTQFREELNGFFATVLGTKPYRVYVDKRHYDQGDCDCYLGQNETLCKHMVAVAIYAVMDGRPLTEDDKKIISAPKCSGRLGELNKIKLAAVKKSITSAMRYIKPYNGPSRIWFAYQNSLSEGCSRLSAIISELPVSEQTAKILVETLLRLDRKLCTGGVDDSDGAVGDFIYETVDLLKDFAKIDSDCVDIFKKLKNKETCFGWEEPLLELIGK